MAFFYPKLRTLLYTIKTNSDNSSVLILEINEDGIFKQKVLFEKERKVFDESGKMIDFGDAYPIVTEYGKIMITKKFINVWI